MRKKHYAQYLWTIDRKKDELLKVYFHSGSKIHRHFRNKNFEFDPKFLLKRTRIYESC